GFSVPSALTLNGRIMPAKKSLTKQRSPGGTTSTCDGVVVWLQKTPSLHLAPGNMISEFGTGVNEPLDAILNVMTLPCLPGIFCPPGSSFLLTTITVLLAANPTLAGMWPVLNGEPGTGVRVRPFELTLKTERLSEPWLTTNIRDLSSLKIKSES